MYPSAGARRALRLGSGWHVVGAFGALLIHCKVCKGFACYSRGFMSTKRQTMLPIHLCPIRVFYRLWGLHSGQWPVQACSLATTIRYLKVHLQAVSLRASALCARLKPAAGVEWVGMDN